MKERPILFSAPMVRRNEALPSCSFFCDLAEQEYSA